MSRPSLRASLLLSLLLLALPLAAQSPERLEGRVVDEAKEPLPQVMVLLLDGSDAPLVYCTTKSDGTFAATVPEEVRAKGAKLSFRLLGLETQTIALADWTNGRTVVMREASIDLHEVEVRAEKIRRSGDTLTYVTSGFRQKQDRTISDVLAKMPGIEVLPTGMIKYQGKAINKFYIEGMDLLGGAYAQASENLDARKVKGVQVLTDHQPIQALRGVSFSDQAALNIVLEDDAKSVWQGVVDLGAGNTVRNGANFLRDGRFMGMLFAPRAQNLSLLKTNDTGKDIKYEIMDLVAGAEVMTGPSPLLRGSEIRTSGLERRRYWQNDSHLATMNQLFRTPKGNDLRIRFHGFYDLSRVEQRRETTYLRWQDHPTVAEALEADNRDIETKAEIKYEVNKPEIFLNSTLTGFADWRRSLGQTTVNGEPFSPEMYARQSWLGHSLSLIRPIAGQKWSLSSRLLGSHQPGRLVLFTGGEEWLTLDDLDWQVSSSFSHSFWRLQATYTLGTHLLSEQMSVAQGSTAPAEERYRSWELYVDPSFRLSQGDWRATLGLRTSLLQQSLADQTDRVKPLFTPSLSLLWEPSVMLRLSLSGRYGITPLSFRTITGLPYYSDYLTVTEGPGTTGLVRSLSGGGSVQYSNTLESLFVNLRLTASRSVGQPLYETVLEGPVYRTRATDQTTTSDRAMVSGRVSKSFGWGRFTTALSGSYSLQRYELLLGSEPMPFRSQGGSLSLSLYYHPLSILSVELVSTGLQSHLTPPEGLDATTLRSYNHTLSLYYMPGMWEIRWDNELFHSSDKSVSSSYFADLSVTYRTDRWEVGAECRNLFGTQTYIRRFLGSETESTTTTLLRPRELLVRVSFSL